MSPIRSLDYPNLPIPAKVTGRAEFCRCGADTAQTTTDNRRRIGSGSNTLDPLRTHGSSKGCPFLCGVRGRGVLNLQDRRRAAHSSVLMHGDHLSGLKLLPLRRVEGARRTVDRPPGSKKGVNSTQRRATLRAGSPVGVRFPMFHIGRRTPAPEKGVHAAALGGRAEGEVGSDDSVAGLVAAPMTPGSALLQPHLFGGGGQGLPEAERKRVDIAEFLQQPESHFPLVMCEVIPDVINRDVVLGSDLFRDQEGSGFQQLGNVHALILNHGFLSAAVGAR